MNYKKNIALVRKYLDDQKIGYVEREDGRKVTYSGGIGNFTEDGGIFDMYKYVIQVDEVSVQSYSSMPVPALTKCEAVAEFIARANHAMTFGNFEMDFNTREVRFHIAFPVCALDSDADEILAYVLSGGANTLHRYARGYMNVMLGVMTPAEAIKEIES